MSLLNALIWLDVQVLRLFTLGKSKPGETISAAAWDLELDGKWQGRFFRPLIDWLMRPFEVNHCYAAWLVENKAFLWNGSNL